MEKFGATNDDNFKGFQRENKFIILLFYIVFIFIIIIIIFNLENGDSNNLLEINVNKKMFLRISFLPSSF